MTGTELLRTATPGEIEVGEALAHDAHDMYLLAQQTDALSANLGKTAGIALRALDTMENILDLTKTTTNGSRALIGVPRTAKDQFDILSQAAAEYIGRGIDVGDAYVRPKKQS